MSEDDIHEVLDRINQKLQKLDRLDELAAQISHHEKILFGQDGNLGLAQQVRVMFRIHVWLLCTLSGGAGTIAGGIAMYFFRK